MQLEEIKTLTSQDMLAVNQVIAQQLESDVSLIQQLGFYIVNSGGKRIRPLITLLATRALKGDIEPSLTLAAIIEFIHTATLLHDDVVDESDKRRGRDTANALFGNSASVLVGDFLYTRSFQMMVSLDQMRVMQILSNATNVIAEGEVMQLMNCNDPETSEKNYMDVIYCKTAKLFEAATQLAAVLNKEEAKVEQAMADYGRYLGTAFQLMDDWLDYAGDADELGKNIGDDLAEGKPTLPLIHALAHGTPEEKALLEQVIKEGDGLQHLNQVQAIIRGNRSLAYTRQKAEQHAQMAVDALDVLADGPYKEALAALAWISVRRNH
ncbi:octaprenyl diphosphate synthase [Gayadomonas joobiniege]|uniref:octaprenyl diphosphate synthase n=1 Tax=Gayadomonas joobiniege TaxID=1234606 RepID=UPI0003726131|nr:octaprenyl diphosphate synthase [Gayadomonas joobiniege]